MPPPDFPPLPGDLNIQYTMAITTTMIIATKINSPVVIWFAASVQFFKHIIYALKIHGFLTSVLSLFIRALNLPT